MGPLVSGPHRDKVAAYVDQARASGATIYAGGNELPTDGYYFSPTILANDTEYGLAAVVWSSDIKRCMRLSTQLNAGIVWINTWLNRDLRTPFGGMNQSGFGREGGQEALRFFCNVKNVCIG